MLLPINASMQELFMLVWKIRIAKKMARLCGKFWLTLFFFSMNSSSSKSVSLHSAQPK